MFLKVTVQKQFQTKFCHRSLTWSVVENAVTWGNFQPKLEKKQEKSTLKKIIIFFPKKSHPKQIFYTFPKKFFIPYGPTRADIAKMFYTQIVFISYILEKKFLYSFSMRFLYYSRSHWCFFSFSWERFLCQSWAIGTFCYFLLINFGTIHVLLFEVLCFL